MQGVLLCDLVHSQALESVASKIDSSSMFHHCRKSMEYHVRQSRQHERATSQPVEFTKDSRSVLTLHCCLFELSSLTSRSRSTVVNLLFSSWDLRKNPLSIRYLLFELAALADMSFSRGAFCLDFFPETPRNTLWTANDTEFFWFFCHGGNERY